MKTYDLVFSDENNDNSKGWKETMSYRDGKEIIEEKKAKVAKTKGISVE